MILSGGTGTGKTNLLLNIILLFASFDKLYMYSKHLHQPKMVMLQEIFDKVADKLGEENILTMSNDIDEVVPVDELDRDCMNLVVFDDFVMEKNQDVIKDSFARGRHGNASTIYLTQAYLRVPRIIRLNSHYFCFFNTPNRREMRPSHTLSFTLIN